MAIGIESTGTIDSIMNADAFEIHECMFNIKDVIQCLFLCSKTMYNMYNNNGCNLFVLTINRNQSAISGMPMSVNDEYNRCVIRNNDSSTPQLEVQSKKNMYVVKDDKIILFVTKGYIMDNFFVKESYHDFRLVEDNPTVRITAQDIESLSMKDPDVR